MSDTEAAKIAAGLTDAEKRAICRLGDRGGNPYGWRPSDCGTNYATLWRLCAKGMAISSRVYGGFVSFLATERGLAVRAYLTGASDNACN